MVFQKSVHEKPIHGLMKTQDVENHMVQEFCWISHHTLWHFNLSLSSCSKLSLVSFSFSKVWRRGKGVWCGGYQECSTTQSLDETVRPPIAEHPQGCIWNVGIENKNEKSISFSFIIVLELQLQPKNKNKKMVYSHEIPGKNFDFSLVYDIVIHLYFTPY